MRFSRTRLSDALHTNDLIRNNSGRITNKTETVAGTAENSVYTYDDLGRLLTVTKDSTLTEEYRYDDNGNRVYETNTALGIAGRILSYSTEDHIMDAGGIIYEFDLDDNLAAKIEGTETTEYAYSSTGELMSVALPDGTAITYIHDPNGRRIAKLVNGTIVEKYLWSGLTTLLAVYDGNDNLLQRFEYADGRMPVAMTAGGSRYYFAYDQVGSLRLVTDSAGNIVKQIGYDTFGNILDETNAGFTVPFGFAGGLHDRDTGLVRFGFRDYMPEIGRWTAKDPILFAGGDSNLYGYVGNDPVNLVDPSGLVAPVVYFIVAKVIALSTAYVGVQSATHVTEAVSQNVAFPEGATQAGNVMIERVLDVNRVPLQIALEANTPLDLTYDITSTFFGKDYLGLTVDKCGNWTIPDSSTGDRLTTGFLIFSNLKYGGIGKFTNNSVAEKIGQGYDLIEAGLSVQGAANNSNPAQ